MSADDPRTREQLLSSLNRVEKLLEEARVEYDRLQRLSSKAFDRSRAAYSRVDRLREEANELRGKLRDQLADEEAS